MSVLNHEMPLLSGEMQNLADYEGQVVLIVNTASKCGFTPQYEGLESIYQEYKEKGLMILGFPCNQFGKQEQVMLLRLVPFARKTTVCRSRCFPKLK